MKNANSSIKKHRKNKEEWEKREAKEKAIKEKVDTAIRALTLTP
jgi:hypothetical protein